MRHSVLFLFKIILNLHLLEFCKRILGVGAYISLLPYLYVRSFMGSSDLLPGGNVIYTY